MLKVLMMSWYRLATNVLPLSDMATLGIPYLDIHSRKALQHGADHVQVDEGEPFVWNFHLAYSRVHCLGLLGQLARVA